MRTKLVLGLLAMMIPALATAEPSDPYGDPQPEAAPQPKVPTAPPSTAPTPAPPPTTSQPTTPVRVGQGPLGVVALDISKELRLHLGAPRDRGVLIDAVFPNTLAARAGLKVGDLVLDIDNAPVTSTADVNAAVGKRKKGDQVVLDVMRTGIPTTLRATLDQDPPASSPRIESGVRALSPRDLDWLETVPGSTSPDQMRQQLEEMRRRLDEMERRFERRRGTPRRQRDGT